MEDTELIYPESPAQNNTKEIVLIAFGFAVLLLVALLFVYVWMRGTSDTEIEIGTEHVDRKEEHLVQETNKQENTLTAEEQHAILDGMVAESDQATYTKAETIDILDSLTTEGATNQGTANSEQADFAEGDDTGAAAPAASPVTQTTAGGNNEASTQDILSAMAAEGDGGGSQSDQPEFAPEVEDTPPADTESPSEQPEFVVE